MQTITTKKAGVIVSISDKTDFKKRCITKNKGRTFLKDKRVNSSGEHNDHNH